MEKNKKITYNLNLNIEKYQNKDPKQLWLGSTYALCHSGVRAFSATKDAMLDLSAVFVYNFDLHFELLLQ